MVSDHTHLTWSAYSKLFVSHQQGWSGALLPRKSAPNCTFQPGWVVHGSHLSFSLNTTIKSVRLSQTPVDGRLLGLLGPYHQHAISTFKTCLRGITHWSLTDTGGGYNLGGASFPHTAPRPFQPVVSTFHLRAPPGLRLSNLKNYKLN
jgi:hypothetical protein